MNFVLSAYVVTLLVVGGYGLSIVLRRREVERALGAWSDAPEAAASDSVALGDVESAGSESDAST